MTELSPATLPADERLETAYKLNDGPLTRRALLDYFLEGCKKEPDLKIGVEWEKIGVYKESGEAIPYSGPKGVTAILQALIHRYFWEPVYSGQWVIALRRGGASITLEPGGQIELSGQKAVALDENAQELYAHLAEIKEVSEPLGIIWLGTGVQPFNTADQIEWVPKERYAIMKENFRNNGELSHNMMKETASIQISLDYTSEKDAVEKFRLAMALAPFFTAIFANSPISEGRVNGLYSRRALIWSQTAPERTGILWPVFKPDFGFEDYVEFALHLPMIFIMRHSHWIPMDNLTFEEFIDRGFGDYLATLADWELHLTTIFTESRLKSYLEIRSVDCQKTSIGLTVPAFVKGIFYDELSRRKAWELVADLSQEERKKLLSEAAQTGLQTPWKGRTILEPARELLKLAESGLGRLAQQNPALQNEAKYLAALKEMLLCGKNPAQEVIEKFDGKNWVQLLSL